MIYAAIAIGVLVLLFLVKGTKKASGLIYKDISTEDARELLKDNNVIALDVRTPSEIAQGKINGAKEVNVTSSSFTRGIKNLDKSKTYVVYCRSGRRSMRACQMMGVNGFKNLYNLKGGYNAW